MSSDYCDYLCDLLASWAKVSVRAMFGGFALYRQGTIFAIVADDMLYFKVGEMNRGAYEVKGSEPLTYEAKGKEIALSYLAGTRRSAR